jgi:hypothetical protein
VTDDRLRDFLRRSHETDAPPPGFAATMRAARAARQEAALPRRSHRLFAAGAAMALVAVALAGWLASRDRDQEDLVAPTFDLSGPFDQLPSPFPGLALADLEDPW